MLKHATERNQPMPDDSIQCMLGRLEQSIEDIKTDVEEIKSEQRKLSDYVNTQRLGVRFLSVLAGIIGATIVGFHEEVTKLLGFKLPN